MISLHEGSGDLKVVIASSIWRVLSCYSVERITSSFRIGDQSWLLYLMTTDCGINIEFPLEVFRVFSNLAFLMPQSESGNNKLLP